MKTLKFLQRFFIFLFVGFSLCAVQACGDDEDDEKNEKPTESVIVDCTYCKTTGKCSGCDGTGKGYKYHDGDCTLCSGTGKCYACDGIGFTVE